MSKGWSDNRIAEAQDTSIPRIEQTRQQWPYAFVEGRTHEVAHRQVAPGKDAEQLSITPQIIPIITFVPARLYCDYFSHPIYYCCQ
jgi:hypothetical protein